jgi:predicted nuclease of predicted toxin-antitoxin system
VRFFLDHDVPADLALVLHACGHQVLQLREALPPDTPDEIAWAHACAEDRIVISCNRAHFLALAAVTEIHPGLIILIRRRTRQAEVARVLTLLAKAGALGLTNNVNFA